MPPPVHRKKPFSAKQKKKQLQDKRERKQDQEGGQGEGRHGRGSGRSTPRDRSTSSNKDDETRRMNQQPGGRTEKGYDPNRYRLHFLRDTREELETRKHQARVPLDPVTDEGLELDVDELYKPGTELDMPKRPPWNYKITREQLNAREEKYFREYLEKLFEQYGDTNLSYFELNLETWRQLWRVVEMADVVLLITDIRHPALHFAPTLYDFLIKELKKPMILVLNKIDLAPPPFVVAWKKFFEEKFPDLHIVLFTSFPKNKVEMERMREPGKVMHKRRTRRQYTAVGPLELLRVCEEIVKGEVDLSSWREKIEDSMSGAEKCPPSEVHIDEQDTSFSQHERFKDGVLHIGCCGYPNVGKSSLMNGLMGRKVVSVSKTPGHTKHFQTIFLTPTVKLIDCPGIVFPSLVPKPLQILAGIYPIAQVREPYTAVGYLSQRLSLPNLLKLKHPEAEEGQDPKWSAYDICEAWAEKRHFLTAKAARLDMYRAANSLLRLAVEARLILCLPPTGYNANKADWENHEETRRISELQQLCRGGSDDELNEEERGDAFSLSDDDEDKDVNEADDEGDSDDDDEQLPTNNAFALLGDE